MKFRLLITLLFISIITYAQKPGAGNTHHFDGSSNRIFYPSLFSSVTLPVTITYWLKIDDRNRVSRIFNSCWTNDLVYQGFSSHYIRDGVNISFGDARGGGHPNFRRTKRQFFSGNDGWFHIAVVARSANDMDIYLNGVDIGGQYSGNGLGMDIKPSCETLIGYGRNNDGEQYLEGQLDELRIWNYALSEVQVRNLLASKIENNTSGLIGFWNFDEGEGEFVKEIISNSNGTIEGDPNWQTSGAPLGDESFFEYFSPGTKRKLFINESDSFWISTESNNWVGYHVYKVNAAPNSEQGSTLNFTNGYYGVFPIFNTEESAEYRIDFGNTECTAGNFRNGNSDDMWEEVTDKSDSSMYFETSEIVEFVFESNGSLNPIKNLYTLCVGESLIIDASSECVVEYEWFDSSTNSDIEISEPGEYWVERTTTSETFRENFMVEAATFESDFLSEDRHEICKGDLPFTLKSNLSQNALWSTGKLDSSISINSGGIYWAEYQTSCGVIRDSVEVEVAELRDAFVPNVLTPNNDNINDCLIIDGELSESEIFIFNRAGVEIFQSDSYQNNWCPIDVPSGVYYYKISNSCYKETFTGWMSILK